ncbi:MAG: hypothetical protein PHS34_08450 [Candidatus Omnitrophica bacterium]|nr:hypothetical protein [Candidatus Nanoarchaeia archaeon]MDD5551275.1 hypothetical protein [Candidatus Omnitrophota bacterium]
MIVNTTPEYMEDLSSLSKDIMIQLKKKVQSIAEHGRPLGHPFRYAPGIWEGYVGKYRLYYRMNAECLELLRFLHKNFQKKLRF